MELLPETGEKTLSEVLTVLCSNLDFLKLFMGAVKAKYGREEESRVLNKPDKSGRTPLMAAVNSGPDGSAALKVFDKSLPFSFEKPFANLSHSF